MKKVVVVLLVIVFAGAIYYFVNSNQQATAENNQSQDINISTELNQTVKSTYFYAITLLDKESLNKYYSLNIELKNKPIDSNILQSLKGEEYEEFESINDNLYQASLKAPLTIEYKKDDSGFKINFMSNNKVVNYIQLADQYNCLYVMKKSIESNTTIDSMLYCE